MEEIVRVCTSVAHNEINCKVASAKALMSGGRSGKLFDMNEWCDECVRDWAPPPYPWRIGKRPQS
jgi:hypothetical protein